MIVIVVTFTCVKKVNIIVNELVPISDIKQSVTFIFFSKTVNYIVNYTVLIQQLGSMRIKQFHF